MRFLRFKSDASVEEVLKEIRGRHPGGYEGLLDVLVDGLRKCTAQVVQPPGSSGLPVLVVGLSGGLDSTVATAIAVRALGLAAVHPLTMPSFEGDPCIPRAALVRRWLGFKPRFTPYEVSVEPLVDQVRAHYAAWRSSPASFGATGATAKAPDRLRLGNLASRFRVALMYDLAAACHGRVLGTGIRTEFLQGYAAKWGTPNSFDIGLLDELFKEDVRELARLLDVPEEVQAAEPGTGYFEGQTHAAELGAALEEQDAVAYLRFEKNVPPSEVSSRFGADPDYVEEFMRRHYLTEHKRLARPEYVPIPRRGNGDTSDA